MAMSLRLSKNYQREKAAIAILSFVTFLLCSCSLFSSDNGITNVDGTSNSDNPNFEGAYKTEFLQTWEKFPDPFIRGVIQDQRITDQEWAETVDRLRICLEGHGMSLQEYQEDGGYSFSLGVNDPEAGNDYADECEYSSGISPIGQLRISMQINPNNSDLDELIHSCLLRVRAVPPSYSLEDFRRDNLDFTFPFLTQDDEKYYYECASAPLTAEKKE